jgi:hypothetical protein
MKIGGVVALLGGEKDIPEFGECWLPREADLGGGGPGGLGPLRGLFDGNVSVIDIRFAIGLGNGATDDCGGVESPIDGEIGIAV